MDNQIRVQRKEPVLNIADPKVATPKDRYWRFHHLWYPILGTGNILSSRAEYLRKESVPPVEEERRVEGKAKNFYKKDHRTSIVYAMQDAAYYVDENEIATNFAHIIGPDDDEYSIQGLDIKKSLLSDLMTLRPGADYTVYDGYRNNVFQIQDYLHTDIAESVNLANEFVEYMVQLGAIMRVYLTNGHAMTLAHDKDLKNTSQTSYNDNEAINIYVEDARHIKNESLITRPVAVLITDSIHRDLATQSGGLIRRFADRTTIDRGTQPSMSRDVLHRDKKAMTGGFIPREANDSNPDIHFLHNYFPADNAFTRARADASDGRPTDYGSLGWGGSRTEQLVKNDKRTEGFMYAPGTVCTFSRKRLDARQIVHGAICAFWHTLTDRDTIGGVELEEKEQSLSDHQIRTIIEFLIVTLFEVNNVRSSTPNKHVLSHVLLGNFAPPTTDTKLPNSSVAIGQVEDNVVKREANKLSTHYRIISHFKPKHITFTRNTLVKPIRGGIRRIFGEANITVVNELPAALSHEPKSPAFYDAEYVNLRQHIVDEESLPEKYVQPRVDGAGHLIHNYQIAEGVPDTRPNCTPDTLINIARDLFTNIDVAGHKTPKTWNHKATAQFMMQARWRHAFNMLRDMQKRTIEHESRLDQHSYFAQSHQQFAKWVRDVVDLNFQHIRTMQVAKPFVNLDEKRNLQNLTPGQFVAEKFIDHRPAPSGKRIVDHLECVYATKLTALRRAPASQLKYVHYELYKNGENILGDVSRDEAVPMLRWGYKLNPTPTIIDRREPIHLRVMTIATCLEHIADNHNELPPETIHKLTNFSQRNIPLSMYETIPYDANRMVKETVRREYKDTGNTNNEE